MTTLPKNEFSKSITSIPDSYYDKCKSTTYAESKTSRITKSFIKTNYATVVSSSSNKKNEQDNKYFLDSKRTFCNNQTHIAEFKDEDESNKGDAVVNANKMISMSLFITKHPLITKEVLPLLLKESFEIDANDNLCKAIIIFFRLLNKSHKDKEYKFSIPKIRQITDNDFRVKPMKKSGKPDFDLPAFDLGTAIKNIRFNSFSLIFNESYLVSSVSTHQNEESKEENNQIFTSRNSLSKDSQNNKTITSGKSKKKVAPISLKVKESHCCNSCLVF